MKYCFMCKAEGIRYTELSEVWQKELKTRNLIAYECPICGDKWIGNDTKQMYSKDGKGIYANTDAIPIEERQKYLWDKYNVIYDGELFGIRFNI